jgi:hypothetical protein
MLIASARGAGIWLVGFRFGQRNARTVSEHFARSDQCIPRGGLLRCVIQIDGREEPCLRIKVRLYSVAIQIMLFA